MKTQLTSEARGSPKKAFQMPKKAERETAGGWDGGEDGWGGDAYSIAFSLDVKFEDCWELAGDNLGCEFMGYHCFHKSSYGQDVP